MSQKVYFAKWFREEIPESLKRMLDKPIYTIPSIIDNYYPIVNFVDFLVIGFINVNEDRVKWVVKDHPVFGQYAVFV